MRSYFKSWANLLHLNKILNNESIVFYSEGKNYYKYFDLIVRELLTKYRKEIHYITSDINDPVLTRNVKNFNAFYVQNNITLIILFHIIKAKVFASTLPDLNTFHLKKSKNVKFHVYIHHSHNSTHMVYRKNAFDNFDVIFCTGPHQNKETVAWEKLYNLKPKKLINCGYGPIDLLSSNNFQINKNTNKKIILIAPSWGKNSIFEYNQSKICELLIENGFYVLLRLHPRTNQLNPNIIKFLKEKFKNVKDFEIDESTDDSSYLRADLMITDWSGASFEFSFSALKPVLFINLPKKINNNSYQEINIEPYESISRKEIGELIEFSEIDTIAKVVNDLLEAELYWKNKIKLYRDKTLYNHNKSGYIGAKALISL